MEQDISTQEFELSIAEYRGLLRRELLKRRGPVLVFVWLILGFGMAGNLYYGSVGMLWFTISAWAPYLLMLGALSLWLTAGQAWRLSRHPSSRFQYQRRRLSFTASGLALETADGSRISRPYSAFRSTERHAGFLLLRDETGGILAVPMLAFPDEEAVGELERRVASLSPSQDPGAQSGEPALAAHGTLGRLRANLFAGARLALLRKPRLDNFSVSPEQAILLILPVLALSIAGDYFATPGEVEFSSYGLMLDGTFFLMMLIAVYFAARHLGQPANTLALVVVLLSAYPLLQLAVALDMGLSQNHLGTYAWLVSVAVFLWLLGVWWKGLKLVFGRDGLATSLAMAMLAGVALAVQSFLPEASYWYSAPSEVSEAKERVNVEELYYAQPGMVSQALESVESNRPGLVDLYHIGFGSYASQKVFRREVNHVRRLLDTRFDTKQRSLVLINDAETARQTPIASASNLKLALQGVAQRMNPQEDILFLYLTSHGSRHAELSVDFGPLQLNQLSAGALRRMLDESGIQWRVLVVSACYSGSFVDTLQDPNTLIITAAGKTRTSFGCSNENEYTYFGEAYFKHALERTHSFIDAFPLAKQWVSRREEAEGLSASRPTLYLGSAIEPKLRQLEQRLNQGET